MNRNTVTVAFDDDNMSVEQVVQSLNQAGYVVTRQQQVE
jgi:copper chaperone CopZ